MVKNKYYEAMKSFSINSKYNVTDEILKYILKRIISNKIEINKLIRHNKDTISFNNIVNAVKEEIHDYVNFKDYKNLNVNRYFLSVQILMPIGVIAVEAFDTIEIIRYFIRAIKSRNAIVISDVEYNELSVKYLIFTIIKEALNKYKMDENLIDILPYNECYYEDYDRVIYTYDELGNKLDKYRYEAFAYENKSYIYLADDRYKGNMIKDNEKHDYELINGDFINVINKINNSRITSAVIYTSKPQEAYEFVNLIKAKNVFVNASLENVSEVPESENPLYEYRNIIIPIPRNNEKNEIEELSNSESLIKSNEGIIEKIKRLLWKWARKITKKVNILKIKNNI